VTGRHQVRSESFGMVTERRHYNACRIFRRPERSALQRKSYFSSSSVISRAFSAICVYSTFGHHPRPAGYLCAKFRFCGDFRCWASPL